MNLPELKILIANGVNLDLLGKREPHIYGRWTIPEIESDIKKKSYNFEEIYNKKIHLHFFQTNSEKEYLEILDQHWDGAILNPGAWTHTSLALSDRLKALDLKYVEVHLSNLMSREPIRQQSFISENALGVIMGMGHHGYSVALYSLLEFLNK